MNFGAMQLVLKRYGFDDTDPIEAWLNAALHDFESAFDWPFLEVGPLAIVLPAVAYGGVARLTLPGDAVKIITFRDEDHLYKMKYYERHKFDRVINDPTDTGMPEVYTLINTNQVQVWRNPVAAVNMQVVYQALVPDMVSVNDVPGTIEAQFPTLCHYPIILLAAAYALQAENEEQRATTALQQYQAALMRCMQKFGERELDEPTTVEDGQGYMTDMPIRGLGSW